MRTMGFAVAMTVGALLLSGCTEKDVDSFVDGTEQADDISILAFKLIGLVS